MNILNKIKKTNYQKIILLLLLLTAFVLGLAIILKSFPNLNRFAFKDDQVNSTKQPTTQSQNINVERRPLPSGLSEDETYLLNPPSPDASTEEKDKHFNVVQKLATSKDVLVLNKCEKPSPLVFKMNLGSEISVQNNDSVDHTLVIDQNHTYKVEANKTTKIKIDFPYGRGAYGYLCDDKSGVVGFFLVEP